MLRVSLFFTCLILASVAFFKPSIGVAYEPSRSRRISPNPETGADAASLYQYWRKYNSKTTNGPMKTRSVGGHVEDLSSVESELIAGKVKYTAYFKGGVLAYDSAQDITYPVFSPVNLYAWPRLLKAKQNFLVIGYGEGIAVINIKTNWFYLDDFAKNDPMFNLESLDIKDHVVYVNEEPRLDLSTLKN
jgi:hypothetical protein